MSSDKQRLYHNCFTRNSDGMNIKIEWDKGQRCIYGGMDNPYWDKKLYNKPIRQRDCKLPLKNVTNRKKLPKAILL